ncbi:MAG TPA: NAD-binding protein [Actinomycetota bacterium]|nr:NAD-binding protein [Actinomycetota bacterium]
MTPERVRRANRRALLVERTGLTPFLSRTFLALLVILITCPLLLWLFERGANPDIRTLPNAYFWMWRTLMEQGSPLEFRTAGGWLVSYLVVIVGVGLVATGTAAIVSRLVDLLLRRQAGMHATRVSDHVLICGWNSHARTIVDELRAADGGDRRPIVILADLASSPVDLPDTVFVRGDPARRDDLARAGLERAATAIVLADDTRPSSSPNDIDGKTLLTALAIESTRPTCYTCVEVLLAENVEHFRQVEADELIVSGEVASFLLASAATDHGVSRIVGDLLTHDPVRGPDNLSSIALPGSLEGARFIDALVELKRTKAAIAVAVVGADGTVDVNPSAERTLTQGDRMLAIMRER